MRRAGEAKELDIAVNPSELLGTLGDAARLPGTIPYLDMIELHGKIHEESRILEEKIRSVREGFHVRNNVLESYSGSGGDVIIPASLGITTIGGGAFAYNSLTSVVIPNSVTSIGGGAFAYNSLTSVVIPNSVRTIGKEAFAGQRLGNGVRDADIRRA
jgi:hypothetical protein